MEGISPKQAGYNDTLFYEYVEMVSKCLTEGALSVDGRWLAKWTDEDNKRQYPVWPTHS